MKFISLWFNLKEVWRNMCTACGRVLPHYRQHLHKRGGMSWFFLSAHRMFYSNLKNKEVNKFLSIPVDQLQYNLCIIWSYLYLPSIQLYLNQFIALVSVWAYEVPNKLMLVGTWSLCSHVDYLHHIKTIGISKTFFEDNSSYDAGMLQWLDRIGNFGEKKKKWRGEKGKRDYGFHFDLKLKKFSPMSSSSNSASSPIRNNGRVRSRVQNPLGACINLLI